MTQPITDYGFRTHVNLPYELAVDKVTAALKEEGFGVLTEIDIQATLKKKLDIDFQKYIILGACNPVLANQALNAELEIGLLLPCNVIVYETGAQQTMVSIVDPHIMLGVVNNADLNHVADEAQGRLRRVLDNLSTNG
ncbi:MAG: DUF302 domain-containing protein [Anaerolineales bacterium]|nr:DUF302 domain-containing protein [Anaerolineales bacterium]